MALNICSGANILDFQYICYKCVPFLTNDTGAVTGTEPGDELYTLPLIEINIVAFQPFNTALFKTNFNFMFFLNWII